jgi:hypothetical protein
MDVCKVEVPQLVTSNGRHASACHLSLSEKERIFHDEVAVQA